MLTRWLGVVLAAGLALLPATAQAGDPAGVFPARYWSYKILLPTTQAASPVLVQDAFFTAPIAVTPTTRSRLVYSVLVDGVGAPPVGTVHYLWWDLAPKPAMPGTVTVTNLFGTFTVQVQNLDFMLVPAGVNSGPIPSVNHYLGYQVMQGVAPSAGVFTLQDELRHDQSALGPMQFLCLPCQKDHAGTVYPILDATTALAAYPITPTSIQFRPVVQDQFFQGTLLEQQSPAEYLFIPSTVTPLATAASAPSWGRVKSRYR